MHAMIRERPARHILRRAVDRRRRPWMLAFGALMLLAAFAAAFGAATAPSYAADSIEVDVTITAGDQPASGVHITVIGGGERVEATSDDSGIAVVNVAEPGSYEFYLDAATLPEGYGPTENPLTRAVTAGLTTQSLRLQLVEGGVTTPVTPPAPGEEPAATASAEPDASASAEPGASPDASATAPAGDGEVPDDPAAATVQGQGFWGALAPKIATGLTFGLLLALASVGVSLIYGTTGLNNFAHGELVTFGGFIAFTLTVTLGLNGWLSLVLTFVLGGVFGWLQDLGIWKPLRRRGVGLIQIMIVSIGLSLTLRYVFAFIYGPDRLALPADNAAFIRFGTVNLRYWDVFGSLIAIVLLVATAWALQNTKIGKATRAVADNKPLAAASGINVDRVIRIVWIAGGALAAVAGVLFAYYQTLRWDMGASILLLIFAAVVLGGLGTAYGALVGSIIIGLFIDISTMWIPSNMKYVGALIVMIIVLLVRPQGILGQKQRIG